MILEGGMIGEVGMVEGLEEGMMEGVVMTAEVMEMMGETMEMRGKMRMGKGF